MAQLPRTQTDLTTYFADDWVPDWLSRQATNKPRQLALIHQDGAVTYAALYSVAKSIAQLLKEFGIQKGDRVAVLARHGLWYAEAVHGIMQAEAVLVPLNTRLTATEIGWQLNNVSASIVLTDSVHGPLANDAIVARTSLDNYSGDESESESDEHLSVWSFDVAGRLNGHELGVPAVEESHSAVSETAVRDSLVPDRDLFGHQLDAVQAIVHTSGTTGNPKGVQITYRNHFWSATASALQLGLDVNERWLVPMPLFHVGGLAVLMRSLIYGTTAILHDTFDASAVNDALSDDDITLISVVPTMLHRMLADGRRRPVGKRLRCILLGGSGASETLLRRCQEEGLPVAQSYGLTEANSQVATLRPEDALRKLGSSGQPLFPTAIRVVGEHGDEVAGKPGELWVHGPTVTKGYWMRADANREVLSDGWLRTGDIGYLDNEGYLYVMDRRKDLIVSGGENIYPAEVEKVLESHPEVIEAGVVGLADEHWGQVPVAFVVLRAGDTHMSNDRDTRLSSDKDTTLSNDRAGSLSSERARSLSSELEAHCRARIAGYKVPKIWRFVSQLPRNASGKLLRRQLIEWLGEQW